MKTRPYHILTGNKGKSRPQNVIFFDTETRPIPITLTEDKHVLRLGWACFIRAAAAGENRKGQWFSFTTPEQFWKFVEAHCKDSKKLYLVAHNVGFDFRIVEGFSSLRRNGWEKKFVYDKGLTTILRFVRPKQSIEILSTTNFFATSLKKLGIMVGLEKREVDFAKASDQALSAYCRRDVEIIIKAWGLWLAFLDDHDLGSFRRTISAQAFAAYRHRFMHTPISIHSNMEVCRFERYAYRGGRTECFRVGTFPKEPYFYLDVNGMYAHQMESQKYPHKLCGHAGNFPVGALENKLRNFSIIARVVISTEEPAFVVKHNKRNVYPVGVFEAVLTTPDLKHALDRGLIKEVKEIAWYNQDYIFKTYTQYFTRLKHHYELESNTAFRDIAKLYINALYGKFGQVALESKPNSHCGSKQTFSKNPFLFLLNLIRKSRPYHRDAYFGEFNHTTKQWKHPPGFHPQHTKDRIPQESYNSFPAIVAHVTAYARSYLWSLICQAGRENTFYCDTDSLVVNQAGYDNLAALLHPTKAGYLKVEKQGTHLRVHAPKDYEISDRIRQKGVRRNATEVGPSKYQQDQFLGVAGAKRRGEPDLVTITQVTKTLKREIKTGIVNSAGWVKPFRFPL